MKNNEYITEASHGPELRVTILSKRSDNKIQKIDQQEKPMEYKSIKLTPI